jgi:hypothetical protein
MTPAQQAKLKTQALSAVRKAHAAQTVNVAMAWFKKADQIKAKLKAATA